MFRLAPLATLLLALTACGGGGGGAAGGPPGPGGAPGAPSAALASLALSEGTLSPPFAPDTLAYAAGPATFAGSVSLTPSAEDPGATIAVAGDPVASGEAASVPLPVGVTPVTVTVTASDATTVRTYTVVFTRGGPAAREAYVKAGNTGVGDLFGLATALSGDTLVVGAPGEGSSATGVNPGSGAEADNSAPYGGAVYVFVRRGSTWAQQAYLKASNTDAGDNFGYAVAIDGDTLAVGALGEASSATGVNPGAAGEADDAFPQAGAVYVFVRSGGLWTQQAYLKSSNTHANAGFGRSVALRGDTLAVGADRDGSAPPPPTKPAAASLPLDGSQGAAYVFVRSGATWSQQALLTAPNADRNDRFGLALALGDDLLAVAAPFEDGSSVGALPGGSIPVGGGQPDSGAVYVFARNGTLWQIESYIKAFNTGSNDLFGLSLALSGDTLVVAAPFEDSAATGVNPGGGAWTDESSPDSGALYVYQRHVGTWSGLAYLKASNTGAGDGFGSSLALSGDALVVGAPFEASSARGVGGGPGAQGDDGMPQAGAVYLFLRAAGAWTQQAYLKASNTDAGDRFGTSVALAGGVIAAGANWEDGSLTGVSADSPAEVDNSAASSGAVYLYR